MVWNKKYKIVEGSMVTLILNPSLPPLLPLIPHFLSPSFLPAFPSSTKNSVIQDMKVILYISYQKKVKPFLFIITYSRKKNWLPWPRIIIVIGLIFVTGQAKSWALSFGHPIARTRCKSFSLFYRRGHGNSGRQSRLPWFWNLDLPEYKAIQ